MVVPSEVTCFTRGGRLLPDLAGGLLDRCVDVGGARVERLRDVLVRVEPGILERPLHGERADDQEGGLAAVDQITQLLDVGPGEATPEVAADAADRGARD